MKIYPQHTMIINRVRNGFKVTVKGSIENQEDNREIEYVFETLESLIAYGRKYYANYHKAMKETQARQDEGALADFRKEYNDSVDALPTYHPKNMLSTEATYNLSYILSALDEIITLDRFKQLLQSPEFRDDLKCMAKTKDQYNE